VPGYNSDSNPVSGNSNSNPVSGYYSDFSYEFDFGAGLTSPSLRTTRLSNRCQD
jgi:hypothetical protein